MLSVNEAHVWILGKQRIHDTCWAQACLSTLAEDERLRLQTIARENDRRNFLLARGLARFALSHCQPDVDPQQWRFRKTRHGRPEVDQPTTRSPIRFNVSHTQDLIAVIVSGHDCGIDVERIDHQVDLQSLATHVLSSAEQGQLMQYPAHQRAAIFFRYWTLKEAYSKALGLGLSLAFDSLEFAVRPAPVLVSSANKDTWQFEQWFATREHLLALAIALDDRQARHTIILHENPPAPRRHCATQCQLH